MRHRVAPRAARDLQDIWWHGFEQHGMAVADDYAARLDQAFTLLADHPELARLRTEVDPPIRAWPCRSHLIVYDVGPDGAITILRVRHHREDWLSDPIEG